MPVISVIIPTYNRATLLREAIDSVLRQKTRDVEILVVDDGSTDDTPAVARNYEGQIVYVRQQNQGVNAARNAAIASARGEFIALLDSDDVYLPYALELMSGLLDRFPQAGFLYADFLILRAGRPPFGPGLLMWHGPDHRWERVFDRRYRFGDLGLPHPNGLAHDNFDVYTGDIYGNSLRGPQVPTSASLIRRSLMGGDRFPESDSLCGDWEFFARLSKRHGAVFADVPVMLNRSHEDDVRLTRVAQSIQLEKRVEMIDRVWRQDPAFLARHGAAVDARQFDLLLTLAKHHLLAGDRKLARCTLERAATMRGARQPLQWLALRLAALVPGAAYLLRGVRAFRRGAWRLLHGADQ
jgi:glycosyltransferase involved in cell wall biosynthesis